jgi:hypothetical protein
LDSLSWLVQVSPSNRRSHVPVESGTTDHHEPPWRQTFDCGFSPVDAPLAIGCSVVDNGGSAIATDAISDR